MASGASKHDRAEKRNRSRVRRTPKQQIASLDERLGVGIGAARERARLGYPIDTVVEVPVPSVPAPVPETPEVTQEASPIKKVKGSILRRRAAKAKKSKE